MKKEEILVFRFLESTLPKYESKQQLTFQFSKILFTFLSRFVQLVRQLVRQSSSFWIAWIRATTKREVSFAKNLIRIFLSI